MNVQAITLDIVDNMSKQSSSSVKKDIDQSNLFKSTSENFLVSKQTQSKQTLTDEDKTKINAIDWILYDPAQRFKLLEYANLTMRYFLLERKNFEATKLVFTKIPNDTIAVVLGQYNYFSSHNTSSISSNVESNFKLVIQNLPNKVSNSIKEYLCFKEYIVSFFF